MLKKPTVRGEVRSTPRVDCAVPGIIQDKGVSIACMVEDLSITGCRVRLGSAIALSQNFLFEFPRKNIKVAAELVWLNGDEAGIRFIHSGSTADGETTSDGA
ncbi:PilZ domain-containing protein [Stappia stellulata]|uniref:PilZ domain-containing protein n=1 Tax=Stappia stellulata TaxID=71235 RepID=UPI000425BC26|nr:PilZ domain-containing protein [Stappia stellulata]